MRMLPLFQPSINRIRPQQYHSLYIKLFYSTLNLGREKPLFIYVAGPIYTSINNQI